MKFRVHRDALFVIAIKFLAFYILPLVLSVLISENDGVLLFILRIFLCMPFALFAVCAVHELFHLAFFKNAGAAFKAIKIGAFELLLAESSLVLKAAKHPFVGYCKVLLPESADPQRVVLAFVSGGLSSVMIGILSVCGMIFFGVIPLLFALAASGLASGLTSLFFSGCQDHQYIIKYLERIKNE